MDILSLFYDCDEFCAAFLPRWQTHLLTSQVVRRRASRLSLSEVMTIVILFQQSGYRNFKTFYTAHVCQHLQSANSRTWSVTTASWSWKRIV